MRRTLVALLALTLSACGGPSGPVEVDPQLVPFDVGRSPVPSPGTSARVFTIYLVRDGRVEPVKRALVSAAPDAEAAITTLLQGPTPEERMEGFGSAIPSVTRLLSVTVGDGVALVDLADEFQGPATPEDVLLRVAQVVWTLVELPEVTSVRFSIEGSAILVPTQTGIAVDRPVTAEDYRTLLAEVATPSRPADASSGPPTGVTGPGPTVAEP